VLDVVEGPHVFLVPDPKLVLGHFSFFSLCPKVDLLVRGPMIERVLAVRVRLAPSNAHERHLRVRLLRSYILILDTYRTCAQLGPALEGGGGHGA
jgi:hypothetical protein